MRIKGREGEIERGRKIEEESRRKQEKTEESRRKQKKAEESRKSLLKEIKSIPDRKKIIIEKS